MIDMLRQIAIFAKVIDHGSFRAAARELRLSPSVVSHHVSQLEEGLGVALIYRSTRSLALTGEGERLLAASQRMLAAVESELVHLTSTADAPSGELKITVPSVLSQSSLMARLARFRQTYPRIRLEADFSDLRRDLINDGFDLAIRMGPKSRNSATSRRLFRVRRLLIASAAYLEGRTKPRELEDLYDWDWLALAPVQNVPLEFSCEGKKPIKLKPEPGVLTNDAQALFRLAEAGAGLAIVPEFIAEKALSEGGVVHILPEWELPQVEVYAVWPDSAPKHGLIHRALKFLSQ